MSINILYMYVIHYYSCVTMYILSFDGPSFKKMFPTTNWACPAFGRTGDFPCMASSIMDRKPAAWRPFAADFSRGKFVKLVGGWPTPLKNMTSPVGMKTFPTEWNNEIHVPNHQLEKIITVPSKYAASMSLPNVNKKSLPPLCQESRRQKR